VLRVAGGGIWLWHCQLELHWINNSNSPGRCIAGRYRECKRKPARRW
jgi:hypothetical protein